MTRNEWLMLATVLLLLILWIFGDVLGIDPTTASFAGLSVLLLAGVLTWEDVKRKRCLGYTYLVRRFINDG